MREQRVSRGFVSGVIWGGVVGAVGLAVASQLAPPANSPLPVPGSLAAPEADALPEVAEAPASPVIEAPVQPQAPATESSAQEPLPEVSEPEAPAVAEAPEGSGGPIEGQMPAETALVETATDVGQGASDAPAGSEGPAEAETPAASEDLAEAETPAEVAPVETPAEAVPVGTATGAGEANVPELQAASPAPASDLTPPPGSEFSRPLPDVDPVLPGPDASVALESAPVVTSPEAAEPASPDTSSTARPEPAPTAPAAPQAPGTEPAAPAALPGEVARAELPSGSAQPGAPAAEPLPGATDLPPPPPLTPEEEALLAQPRLITPDAPLVPETPAPEPEAGVTTNRLPRIGDVPAAAEEEAEAPPPVQAFAREFDNPAGKPLFSILLIDTGGPDLDREALAALPFPVSFVIDPLAPDAATAAAIYRKAGQEVLMLATGIPQGATASDLEVTFAAHARALPEAVGLVDLPEAGFQGDRTLSAQVATLVADQGRGMVTHDRGLNAADQVARRQGLPAAVIFRRLDGEDEGAPAIRRYLDRAAFKAAQDGRVAVIGETRPETVQALVEWSVEGRAGMVALAPATAAMGE